MKETPDNKSEENRPPLKLNIKAFLAIAADFMCYRVIMFWIPEGECFGSRGGMVFWIQLYFSISNLSMDHISLKSPSCIGFDNWK